MYLARRSTIGRAIPSGSPSASWIILAARSASSQLIACARRLVMRVFLADDLDGGASEVSDEDAGLHPSRRGNGAQASLRLATRRRMPRAVPRKPAGAFNAVHTRHRHDRGEGTARRNQTTSVRAVQIRRRPSWSSLRQPAALRHGRQRRRRRRDLCFDSGTHPKSGTRSAWMPIALWRSTISRSTRLPLRRCRAPPFRGAPSLAGSRAARAHYRFHRSTIQLIFIPHVFFLPGGLWSGKKEGSPQTFF